MNRFSSEKIKEVGGFHRFMKQILPAKPAKYRNTKNTWKGVFNGKRQEIVFHSKKELERFIWLKTNSKVKNLKLQVKFLLTKKSKTERASYYIADFVYTAEPGLHDGIGGDYIDDTKGYKTQLYILKRKIVKEKYPEFKFIES